MNSANTLVKVLEPRVGWLGVNWRELWRYRELLLFLTWRDVVVRYKQTVLGVLWAVIQPFIKLVVFSVIFGGMAKIDSEGYPYPVFLYAALLPWQFFSEALNRSSMSVVGGGNLITKVYFPRLIIPIASVGSCLVDFAIAFSILVGLMLYYGVAPTVAIWAVVPLVVVTVFVALGVGILLSGLAVAYRDFRYINSYVLQLWIFVTPVFYSLHNMPEKWKWLCALNPMTGVVDAYRSAILGRPFAWSYLAVSLTVALILLVAGLFIFRRLERRFADII